MRTYGSIIGLVLVVGWGMAGPASAQDIKATIASAMKDAEKGRCEQAYRRLAEIDGLETRGRLLAGQCRIRAGRYPEALDDLDRVRGTRDLNPEQAGDVELYRAIALYHLERYTEATAALDQADGITANEAELELYRGLIALRDGDNDRAAPALETAARLSPAMTEPVASYYAGLAWQGASERRKARAAFQRVVNLDGDGPWGKEAAKLLESTELIPYFIRGSVGIEYDDNVILRGGVTQFNGLGDPLESRAKRENDWRGVWRLDAGAQLFRAKDWSGGVSASYSGNAHDRLPDFNTHYPTVGAYLANRINSKTAAQIRTQFGFAWVDDESFLRSQNVEFGISHLWSKAGTTFLAADILWDDLRFTPSPVADGPGDGGPCAPLVSGSGCSPIGVDESRERNRDGVGYGAAVEHRYSIPIPAGINELFRAVEIAGGYRFRYYDSEGTEWKHMAHTLTVGLEVELPHDFSVRTSASYEYRDFSDPSTYPDNEIEFVEYSLSSADREEHEVTFEAEIEKEVNDHFSVSFRWSYLDNESNRRIYDYSRHIVGGYLNFQFD